MVTKQMKKWVIGAVAFAVISGSAWAEPVAEISKLGYSVQVGAFSKVDNAERLASKLQDKGIEAYYFKKENNVFAVRFGNYATRKEAKIAAKELTLSKLVDSYYIASPITKNIQPLTPAESDPADPAAFNHPAGTTGVPRPHPSNR